MVNFCVFSLLHSNMRHEKHLEIFPYGEPPHATGKLGKLTPLPPGKSDPFRGGGMDIFWNHTLPNLFPWQFTKKSSFLFIKAVLDSYHLNFSWRNFAYVICSSCTFFFHIAFTSIYSFNNLSHANKKASSKQSTLHASANRLIFYTTPVSFVGLKTARI